MEGRANPAAVLGRIIAYRPYNAESTLENMLLIPLHRLILQAIEIKNYENLRYWGCYRAFKATIRSVHRFAVLISKPRAT